MKNIQVFRGFYTFEDTYRSCPRLSVCAHGEYNKNNFIGYLLVPNANRQVGKMTPNELHNQLFKERGIIDRFRYIRLIVCDAATCEKDYPDSPYNFDESFASAFSKLCPNKIIIGYIGPIYGRTVDFDESNLSYRHDRDVHRHEEVFNIGHIYQLHFGDLSRKRMAKTAFMAEKEAYSKVETNDPITPIPFLRPKVRGKAVNHFDESMVGNASIWFKNGKRIHAEMLLL
ncbi:hypothetical protein [Xenorhabdus lircayensis]|uniref:Uncharacterized protein n=1 Tax=Xenorhabdus lircayensis TaxID=2763499 RepID=A0ABS0U2K7_9GAMM|nr:hypothetical protein [Xenorhabdus lircayensis]MBI6548116.1 hypothetical protein [Xenorhabdus lircayensis]